MNVIYGIGIDNVEIKRIEKSIQSEHFLKRVFGDKELVFLKAKKNHICSAAANFAAKEAFGKALKTGICSGNFKLCDVQILRAQNGEPYYYFTNEALNIMNSNNLKAHLSLTHDGGIASAFVVLETI